VDKIAAEIEPQIPSLRRYAYALTRNHAAADDLVQDTLERALSHWLLRRRDGDLRAWLFAILRNLYLGQLRQAKRRGPHVALDAVPPLPQRAQQETVLEAKDVLAALDHLPEDQQSLLLLIGIEDFSYQQTAHILRLPVGTVMSRLSRARARLREILDKGQVTLLRRVK
jgi:RNA polymerase sigma-70 factor (ECF subfamily)